MNTEQNKAAAQRFYAEGFSKGDTAVVDEIFATSYDDHNALPMQEPGVEGFKKIMMMFRTSFPDLHFEVQDLIAEGDKVVARWVAHGTDSGSGYMGMPPTNRQADVPGIDILRFENGKVVERWGQVDYLGLMMQLGIIPALGQ